MSLGCTADDGRCAGASSLLPTRRRWYNVRVVRLSASVCIEAPAVEVWTRLARLEDIAL